MKKKKDKNAIPETQRWLGVLDIYDGVVYKSNGQFLVGLKIEPRIITYISEDDLLNLLETFSEALDGNRIYYDLHIVKRPIDLRDSIYELESEITNDEKINKIVKAEIQRYLGIMYSEKLEETVIYLILKGYDASASEIDRLKKQLRDMQDVYRSIDIKTFILDDYGLKELFQSYAWTASDGGASEIDSI